jgi:hypothetical protein
MQPWKDRKSMIVTIFSSLILPMALLVPLFGFSNPLPDGNRFSFSPGHMGVRIEPFKRAKGHYLFLAVVSKCFWDKKSYG